MKRTILLIIAIIFTSLSLSAQTDTARMRRIGGLLTILSENEPAYTREIDLSIGKISMAEILRHIAGVGGVNISVKSGEGVQVSCNFTKVRINDLIYFLCNEYNFDLSVIGNIVSVYPVAVPTPPKRELKIEYDTLTRTLSYDLLNDHIVEVTKIITTLTGINITVPQNYYTKTVSGFVQSVSTEEAIQILARTNSLEVEKSSVVDGVWNVVDNSSATGNTRKYSFSANELFIDSLGLITARISRANMADIITELCERQHLNYYFISPISQDIAIYVRSVPFDTLLDVMMSGTQGSYYNDNNVYVFGNLQGRDKQMASVQIVKLSSRAVMQVAEAIPDAIKSGIQVYTFPDLNALILSGDQRQVARVANFVHSIDRNIPMVTIEVIIVDVTDTDIREMGLGFGVGASPAPRSSATLSPGVSANLNAESINSLINSFNGFGLINLGKVSENFYMNLKLLEEKGKLTLRSTPKLSTLNGHEATLKSGETKYYKEITNNYIGYQNPTITENYIWKSVDANLSLKITPYIGENNTITLQIEIEQTEFTAREEPDAPPGTTTRSFKSIIKVVNGEMVLLGGIDRNSVESSSKGLPWVARVPVLRWLFGYTKRNKIEQKLNVFIKSTIVE